MRQHPCRETIESHCSFRDLPSQRPPSNGDEARLQARIVWSMQASRSLALLSVREAAHPANHTPLSVGDRLHGESRMSNERHALKYRLGLDLIQGYRARQGAHGLHIDHAE